MNEPATLADLVNLALQNTGATSVRQLDRIAKQRGHTLTYTTANSMRAGTYASIPSRETCDVLAALTGLPAETVYRIAGTRVPGEPIDALLPPDTDLLDVNQKRVAVEMLRGFVRDQKRILELEQENASLKQRVTELESTSAPGPRGRERGPAVGAGAEPEQKKVALSSLPGWHDDQIDLPDDLEALPHAADRGTELDDGEQG